MGYRGSALAHDDRDGAAPLRAGDRAPDATGLTTTDGERRLFDLTRGGHFTLLDFGTRPVSGASPDGRAAAALPYELRTLHVVEDPAGPDDVADTEGRLTDAYGAADDTLVLIRPDGHIGVISDAGDVSTVWDHLAAKG